MFPVSNKAQVPEWLSQSLEKDAMRQTAEVIHLGDAGLEFFGDAMRVIPHATTFTGEFVVVNDKRLHSGRFVFARLGNGKIAFLFQRFTLAVTDPPCFMSAGFVLKELGVSDDTRAYLLDMAKIAVREWKTEQ